MPPTVSINLCCYNSEKHLRKTLDSVVSQTWNDWELIIVNDGSSDATEDIVQEYIDRGLPIVYHVQANAGLGRARNKALSLSSGKFIAFIDHDDQWMPQKLEIQMPHFDDPEVGLVYADALYFNDAGDQARLYGTRPWYQGRCFGRLVADYFICMQTVVIRKSALNNSHGWFDERFSMSEERDLFTRIGHKWKLSMVDMPLAKWRVHYESLSWSKGHLFSDENEMMIEKFQKLIPGFSLEYKKVIAALRRQNAINKAMFMWYYGRGGECRQILRPLLRKSIRACILSALTFFPEPYVRKLLTSFRKTKIFPRSA